MVPQTAVYFDSFLKIDLVSYIDSQFTLRNTIFFTHIKFT